MLFQPLTLGIERLRSKRKGSQCRTTDRGQISIYHGAADYLDGEAVVVAGIDDPKVALVADLDGDDVDDFVVTPGFGSRTVLVRSGCD